MNAWLIAFSTSTKRIESFGECLNHFVILGERHLRHLVQEYVTHYNAERFHQGLGGGLVTEQDEPDNDNGVSDVIQRRKRLGGVLNFYHRKAA